MQLKAIHLFLIILLVLILCCGLGKNTIEGLESASNYQIANNNNALYASSTSSTSSTSSFNPVGVSGGNPAPPQASITSTSYGGPQNSSSDVYSSSSSKVVVTSNGQQVLATPNNTVYGVPQSQIQPGQEDLYILKSQVVPPVCPACPPVTNCNCGKKDCPACPPCARCPEPAFECKKVPNYQTNNSRYLPRPVLSDFSQFGM